MLRYLFQTSNTGEVFKWCGASSFFPPQECCNFVINPSLLFRLKLITGFSKQPEEVQGQNKNAWLPEPSDVPLLLLLLRPKLGKGYCFLTPLWRIRYFFISLLQLFDLFSDMSFHKWLCCWKSQTGCRYAINTKLSPTRVGWGLSALLWFVV